MWKQSMKHGQNKIIVRSQQKPIVPYHNQIREGLNLNGLRSQ